MIRSELVLAHLADPVSAVLALLAAPLLVSHSFLPSPQTADASASERLDELIAASHSIDTFHARYSLTFELNPGATVPRPPNGVVRIAQRGTQWVRTEHTVGDVVTRMWCDGTDLVMQGRSPTDEFFARVETSAFDAEAAQLREQLEELFPGGSRGAHAPIWAGPAAVIGWSFNDQAQRANFEVKVVTSGSLVSPLGWLETLHNKDAALVDDGERLHFDSDDGHFRGALRARDGVLETLVGESPNGRFTLSLQSFSREATDLEAFEPPAAPAPGTRDGSSEMRRAVLSSLHLRLRLAGYRAVGRCEHFDDKCAANASRWLTRFHDFVIHSNLSPWFDMLEKRRVALVEGLNAYAASGRSKSEVEEQRQREVATLGKDIDEVAGAFDDLLDPLSAADAPRHAQEFHELEKRSFAAAFDSLVRRKVLSEFEAATKLD